MQSPQEELSHLIESVSERENNLSKSWENIDRESVIREEVRSYAKAHPDEVLEKGYKMLEHHAKEIVLELAPETHDKKMEELLSILQEKGIKNTLTIVELMQNAHIQDDFHRFLVQYVKAGLPTPDLSPKDELLRSLNMSLYEVDLPDKKEENEKPLEELISSMEQFYAGMISVGGNAVSENDFFSIELANPEGTNEAVFYVAVPSSRKDLFEKHILSIFPKAKVFEKNDDYNIFNYDGITIGAQASFDKNPIFPLKTYDKFDYDPLNILLNTFSKIERDGEGAAVQIILRPDKDGFLSRYKEALRELERGIPIAKALDIRRSVFGEILKATKDIVFEGGKEMMGVLSETKENNERQIEELKNKVSTPILEANIRVVASAKSREKAAQVVSDIISSFNQFENTGGNKFVFEDIKEKNMQKFTRLFSYRKFDKNEIIPISIGELTTIMHFPARDMAAPHLKVAKASTAPAPVGLPNAGTLLGVNLDRNTHSNIYITGEDRLRHMYVVGQTGTGKTTLLKNMIAQDIISGAGVCMIDPHGSDIQDILSIIPPERYEDVIYFDPGYAPRPMALNMLEYDPNFPEQKTFVVNEMLSIFNKLFDMKTAGGPMFEQYFRNAVLLVMEDPESGNTLLDVSRVLAVKSFREMKIARCKNPIVVQFWQEIAGKAGGEASLSNIVPYITSKFDVFLTNDIMRPIVSQEHSTFDFRDIMDNRKILLVNLSKGRLGDINSNLIGLIIVGKILMSALSRADSFGKNLPPFYLFIDEFQNITTDSISQILSEARKYKLSLTIAHQFIAQLEDDIKDAVFGNVGSIASFRVGADDAEYLEKQFEPIFTANDLINLDNRNAYMKLLVEGRPVRPFSMETIAPMKGELDIVPKLKELSYLKYGRDRSIVEEEIMLKYRKEPPPAPPTPQAQSANPFAAIKP